MHVSFVAPNATSDFDKEAFLHLTARPLQVCFYASKYEVVAVHSKAQIFATVPTAAWAGQPSQKSHALQRFREKGFPSLGRVSSAAET